MFHTDRVVAAGTEQRLPFALLGPAGQVEDHEELMVEVNRDGQLLSEIGVVGHVAPHDHVGATADTPHQHSDQLRFYPLRARFDEPGIYDLTVIAAGQRIALPVQAFAPDEVDVIGPGQPMPPIETPTLDAARGVDPICTLHDGPCPLHGQTLAAALEAARPTLLLVGSPAYCANAFCASSLRLLIDRSERLSGVTFLHAEPYAQPRRNGDSDPVTSDRAPVMEELGLAFEPALFAIDGDGNVVDRLDAVLSAAELDDVLERLGVS